MQAYIHKGPHNYPCPCFHDAGNGEGFHQTTAKT